MTHYIFNQPISIKTYDCNREVIDPRVNIFVRVTNKCNANCKFCSDKSLDSIPEVRFDTRKLINIINEIEKNEITVNKVNITGGEPSMNISVVKDILEKVPDHIHLHLNTNGISDESRELMKLERWNSISMSVHHYSIPKIMEIYGVKRIPANYMNFDGIDLSKLNFSCNLIKGYIDNPKEMVKMMKSTKSLGIKRLGFVTLMKYNEYCNENYVPYSMTSYLPFEDGVEYEGKLSRLSICKCSNYNYKGLKVYIRSVNDTNYNESTLVYGGVHLYQGFNSKEVII